MTIGFIQSELDLKLLVLYIMDRAAGPITFLQLFELALCDAGVDYFSLSQAVDHMVLPDSLLRRTTATVSQIRAGVTARFARVVFLALCGGIVTIT